MAPRRWMMLLLPGSALLLWSLLFFTREQHSSAVEDGPPAAERPQRELMPQAVGRTVHEVRPAQPVQSPGANDAPVQLSVNDSERSLAQAQFERKRGELEARNAERFVRAAASFGATSPRPEPDQRSAAREREHKLRAALEADGAGPRVRAVECRDPLCKLEIAAPEPMDEPLGRGLNFMREAGVQTASAFAGQGAARALTIYVLREGVEFEALGAPPAQRAD